MSRSIESVMFEKLRLDLLATGDGTEVILHHLPQDRQWSLFPQAGWDALEFIYVLSGQMTVTYSDKRTERLGPGDHLAFCPVKEVLLCKSQTDTTFLYVTSRPVFQSYSRVLQEMRDLAVSVEAKDGYTYDHCRRIAYISKLVGQRLGLTPEQLLHLNLGAFLHDLGKVRLPQEILGKKGPLTPEEWAIVRQHPTFGAELLMETEYPPLMAAAKIVEQHHERWDGNGYPHGLKGDQILITAAIVTLVDSFDAMTTHRSYRQGRSWEEAVQEILRCKGTQFHPDVVDAFMAILPEIKL